MRKALTLTLVFTIFTLSACTKEDQPFEVIIDCDKYPTHKDCTETSPIVPTTEFVEELLADMTLAEKAAQMVQAERGSISPSQVGQYGIGSILSGGGSHPSGVTSSVDDWYNMYSSFQEAALNSSSGIPIIYGIDAVHGNNNLYGATIFPHNIGLGAANDPDLVYAISQATAQEMLITGINWTFAPALSVVQNIQWGRSYEGYSENPLIHQNLTQSAILGFEENGVSATAKHFFGDGGTANGTDQGNTVMLTDEVIELHLAPYVEAIEAGVDTIMISYSSINGYKVHGSSHWITDVLKDEMGFDGFIISDWNAIHQLSGSYNDQVVASINAGVDMLMEPYDWENAIQTIINMVNENRITEARIDDAVLRILTVKYNRGLFDDPTYRLEGDYLYSEDHAAIARQAVRESLVLLQNNNDALPINGTDTVYITGPGADHVGYQCGGWTNYWQGNDQPDIGAGISILDAFTEAIGSARIVNNMAAADTVIVVLAEVPYSEGNGDNWSLSLTSQTAAVGNATALATAQEAQSQGKNVIGILLSGRPLLIEDYLNDFDAFVAAWLPGTEGGHGIADVLLGDYDFSGKLPVTWPRTIEQVGYNSNRNDYDVMFILYPFGYGLTYMN